MSPQQIHERILADCSALAKVFIDERRFRGAAALSRAAAMTLNSAHHMSVEDQVAEMSEPDYQPRVTAEGRSA